MGESSNNIDNEQFSGQGALDALRIAVLPNEYEKNSPGFAGLVNSLDPMRLFSTELDPNAARNAVIDAAPASVRENINIITVDNTTAVIAYDPENHSVTIAFDPTHKGDGYDNFNKREIEHSLGGEVHRGLYSDLTKDLDHEIVGADNMVDVLENMLHDYASRNEQPLSVNITGFSKGASQAALATGELMSRDFFENNDTIKLDNVYLFGQIAFADQEFTQNFDKGIEENGAQAFSVQLHGDDYLKILTPDSENCFTKHGYAQVGEHIYMMPDSNNQGIDIIVNPDQEQLDELYGCYESDESMHDLDRYEDALKLVISGGESMSVEPNVTPIQPIDDARPVSSLDM